MKNENVKQFTPGPWVVSKIRNTDVEIGGDYYLQYRHWDKTVGFSIPAANARLISAAPELLEALKTALVFVEERVDKNQMASPDKWVLVNWLKSAIAKAEGK